MTNPERLLHFIWRFRLYDQFRLKSQCNEDIEVLDPGIPNIDAGPDFLMAKVRIGVTVWVGNVEIHTKAKYWNSHGHQDDRAYDNVILHVIWNGYCDVLRRDNSVIPTLQLHNYVDSRLLEHYEELMGSISWIPCSYRVAEVSDMLKIQLKERMLIDRLESKYAYVLSLLEEQANDWEKVTYMLLYRAFGMRVNKEAFTQLSLRVPLALVEKYRNSTLKVEALLFGQAGLLESSYEEELYPKHLKQEYDYLATLHGLKHMSVSEWKFMRMRPVNFPTLRIAQLAALLRSFPRLFGYVLEAESVDVLKSKLKGLDVNPYWDSHFHFQKSSAKKQVGLSGSFVSHLVINCFCVVLYAYGRYVDQYHLIDKALDWLSHVEAENNRIIKQFMSLGFKVEHAGDSQALLHLKSVYCDQKKCLDCHMGQHLIRV